MLNDVRYVYDVNSNRIAQIVNGQALFTVYDGDSAWADFSAAEQVEARYLFGDSVDEMIARFRPSDGLAWYLTDSIGSVRDLVNAAGNVILAHIDYDSFGQIVGAIDLAVTGRFLYAGREWDAVLRTYSNRFREYDPATGTFLSADPLGLRLDNTNLYVYASNNPLSFTDPFGLTTIAEDTGTRSNILARIKAAGECLGREVVTEFVLTTIATEAGVYFFIGVDGRPYVGQSEKMGNRITRGHRASGGRLRGVPLKDVRDRILGFVKVSGTKLRREQIERFILDALGGPNGPTSNRVRPLGTKPDKVLKPC